MSNSIPDYSNIDDQSAFLSLPEGYQQILRNAYNVDILEILEAMNLEAINNDGGGMNRLHMDVFLSPLQPVEVGKEYTMEEIKKLQYFDNVAPIDNQIILYQGRPWLKLRFNGEDILMLNGVIYKKDSRTTVSITKLYWLRNIAGMVNIPGLQVMGISQISTLMRTQVSIIQTIPEKVVLVSSLEDGCGYVESPHRRRGWRYFDDHSTQDNVRWITGESVGNSEEYWNLGLLAYLEIPRVLVFSQNLQKNPE